MGPLEAGNHTTIARRGGLLLGALVLASHGRALSGGVTNWDDQRFLQSAFGLRDLLAAPQFESYSPLFLASLELDRRLWPDFALGAHATNLALYLGAVLLLHRALARLGVGALGAFAGAAWFACHPVHVELVAWICGRKHLLGLLLGLVALTLSERARTRRGQAAGLAVYVLAVLASPAAAVLPAWVALRALGTGDGWRGAARAAAPWLVVGVLAGIGAALVWSARDLLSGGGDPVLIGESLAHYLAKSAVPVGLSAIYAPPRPPDLVLGAVGLAATGAALVLAWRARDRRFLLGAGFAVLAILPFCNLGALYFFANDRYLAWPTVGLAVVIALGTGRLATRFGARPVLALVGVVVIALGAGSALRTGVWRSSGTLWRDAVAREPEAYYARLKLAETLREEGDLAGALDQYRAAIRLDRAGRLAHWGLLHALLLRDLGAGRADEARAALEDFARAYEDARALRAMGRALLLLSPDAALVALHRAAVVDPDPEALAGDAAALRAAGREAAARAFEQAREP